MEKSKRSFEFRMSKKVAELTQVVHMLFTRNHEKEVEMEALKGAYEYEIELILTDAKSKISILDMELSDLRKLNSSKQPVDKLQSDAKLLKEQYENKIKDLEASWKEEKTECQNLRDLLINAQSDIEKLRQGVSEQLMFKSEEVSKRDIELDQLRKHSVMLEKRLKDVDKDAKMATREADRNAIRLQDELSHAHSALDECYKNRDCLTSKNKQLETELKNSKKDFNRKVSEVVSNQAGRLFKNVHHHSESGELERLRKEIQKYRLELSNRDWNFNRMFTEKQPIFVDPRAAGKAFHNQRSLSPANGIIIPPHPTSASCVRERSLSQIITLPSDEKKSMSQRPCSAVEPSQLPTISPTFGYRTRITKLVKPKPLPKEMLFSK